jgi:hypothetical protein
VLCMTRFRTVKGASIFRITRLKYKKLVSA